MGLFESFRDPGWNTYHADRPNALQNVDVTTAVVTYLAVVLAAAMLMVVIGTRGRERWTTFFRLLLSLHTGVVIIFCILGNHWQLSDISSHSEYSLEVDDGIHASVGLRVGLKSLNVTLQANQTMGSIMKINYNEEFSFNRVHDMRENFLESLERGLPYPIIYALEYFSVDAGGLRWQRGIRTAGHFTYILLWTSLLLWFIANILLCFVPSRGLFMLTLTGLLMLVAVVVYHTLQPPTALEIPFEDDIMTLNYGWCFWLCLTAGVMASVSGISLLVLHYNFPWTTNRLFLIDYSQLQEYKEAGSLFSYSPGPLKIDTPFSRRMNRMFVGRDKWNSTLSLSSMSAGVSSKVNQSTSGNTNEIHTFGVASDVNVTDDDGGRNNEAFQADELGRSTFSRTSAVDEDCETPAPRDTSFQPEMLDSDGSGVLDSADYGTSNTPAFDTDNTVFVELSDAVNSSDTNQPEHLKQNENQLVVTTALVERNFDVDNDVVEPDSLNRRQQSPWAFGSTNVDGHLHGNVPYEELESMC